MVALPATVSTRQPLGKYLPLNESSVQVEGWIEKSNLSKAETKAGCAFLMITLASLSFRVCPIPSSLTGTASSLAGGAAIRSNEVKGMKRRIESPLSDSSLLWPQLCALLCQIEAAPPLGPSVSKKDGCLLVRPQS